jgi:hypothetical protein
VIERIGVHGLHDGDVVHDLGQVRQKLRQFRAALAVLRELELRPEQRGIGVDERGAVVLDQVGWRRLAIPLRQLRFVIEQLQVTRCAGLEEKNDALGLRRKMRLLRRERVRWRNRRCPALLTKQRAKRDRAQAHATLLKKPTAGDQLWVKAAIEMGLAVHRR